MDDSKKVINTLVLDPQHRPLSSHTLKFGFEDKPLRPPTCILDSSKRQYPGQLNSRREGDARSRVAVLLRAWRSSSPRRRWRGTRLKKARSLNETNSKRALNPSSCRQV